MLKFNDACQCFFYLVPTKDFFSCKLPSISRTTECHFDFCLLPTYFFTIKSLLWTSGYNKLNCKTCCCIRLVAGCFVMDSWSQKFHPMKHLFLSMDLFPAHGDEVSLQSQQLLEFCSFAYYRGFRQRHSSCGHCSQSILDK